MYHTVTSTYLTGRNPGRGSRRTVISQFAQIFRGMRRLCWAGAASPRGDLALRYRSVIITHQQPPLDPLVHLAEGRGVVVRGLRAGFVPLCDTKGTRQRV